MKGISLFAYDEMVAYIADVVGLYKNYRTE